MRWLVSFFVVTLTGCGYIGDTRPPSLNLPVPVRDLAAVQRGTKIIVQFTVPRVSTDGLPLKDPPVLELFIAGNRFPVKSDKALAYDEELATPFAGQTVKIGIKAENDHGQDSGWSNIIDLPVVQPLATPADLKADAVAGGVQLTWKSNDRKFRIFREGPDEKTFTEIGESDARVFVDTTAVYGKTSHWQVMAVDPSGAQSELSGPAELLPIDKFAPAVPTHITPVVGTQSVELIWDRDVEPDLAGYRIYRDGVLLGESKNSASYSDRAIEHGKRYSYAISAFDKLNNESAKSEPVEVLIP